jgi:translation initiation factor 5B
VVVLKVRQPIVTVLGHVDHGKTLLLDKVRGTAVAEKEAGAITQHIGATAMPIDLIDRLAGKLMKQYGFQTKLPGLLFIDTPGHAAFTSLRERGGSIADIAVLVVDITQGFQPQTMEAIRILKAFKTPFVVAANKLDLLNEWESREGEFSENLKQQGRQGAAAVDEKVYSFVGKLHGEGFQSERFDRCRDFTKEVPIVPISAKTGEGLPELLMLLAGLSQKFLEKKLSIDENEAGKGAVLEVKEEKGLGKTIDVILYSGVMKVNDQIVLAGRQSVLETKVRALLMPKPLHEIRISSPDKFLNVKEVHAAAGVKIVAPGLEDALAGSPILVEKTGDEKKAIAEEIASVKKDTDAVGPVVKADTLGSLEAMVVLLEKEAGLKPRKADVGEVTRRDVMEALAEKEKDPFRAVVFAFNVKVEETAVEEARNQGVEVFSGKVVYSLIEEYSVWVKQKQAEQKKEKLNRVVLPVKMRFMHGFVFRHSKPAVIGVKVLEGRLRPGIRVFNEKGRLVGKVGAVQVQGKSIDVASKGQEVAVSIDKGTVGRNLEENKVLYSFIPQQQFSEIMKLKQEFNFDEQELISEIADLEKKMKKTEEEAE